MRGMAAAMVTAAVGLACASAAGATSVTQVRVGTAPQQPAHARVTGPVSRSTPLGISVALEPRDPAALASYASAVSTPGSSSYHQYLSVAAFRQQFGSTDGEIAAVAASLRSHGLDPGPVSANGLSIPVSATAGAIGHAFSVSLVRVALPGGQTGIESAQAPLVDASVAHLIQGVVGLDVAAAPKPLGLRSPRRMRSDFERSLATPAARATGGPQPCSAAETADQSWYAYTANQIASAYQFSSLYESGDLGAGETVAVLELEPNLPSDIAAFQACYGTDATVNYIPVDGGAGSGAGSGEAALDIENVISVAPKATIDVYQAPDNGIALLDAYSDIVENPAVKVVTTSWGTCEADSSPSTMAEENTLFEEAAAQGQTVFAASGDQGSEDCGTGALAVDDPASQPWVTSVGGTSLSSLSGPRTETAWNDASQRAGAGGGGLSSVWRMPSYQSGAAASLHVVGAGSSGGPCGAPGGSYCREVPDVSADADPYTGYLVYYDGGWTGIGGTSASAPLWAGFMALVDASGECHGSPIGFANPVLYRAAATGYARNFNDVVSGNNDYTGTNGGAFAAGPGYDMVSGLGTPVGSSLPAALCDGGATPAPAPVTAPSTPAAGKKGSPSAATASVHHHGLEVTITGAHRASDGATFTELVTVENLGSRASGRVRTRLQIPRGLRLLRGRARSVSWATRSIRAGGHVAYRVRLRVGAGAGGTARLVVTAGRGTTATAPITLRGPWWS